VDHGRDEGKKSAIPVPIVRAAKETRPAPPRRSGRPIVWVLGGIGIALLAAGSVAAYVVMTDTKDEPVAEPLAALPDAGVEELEPDPDAGAPVVAVVPQEPPPPPERACPDRSGRWSGQWAALTQRGTWSGEFHEVVTAEGFTELHGDIRVTGTTCGSGGHLMGRVQDDCSVAFDPQRAGPCRVRYTATFDGDSLRGDVTASAFGMREDGWWVGTREAPAEPVPTP
jgi:hypothetical protein